MRHAIALVAVLALCACGSAPPVPPTPLISTPLVPRSSATATRAASTTSSTATAARTPTAVASPTRAWGPPGATLTYGAETRIGQRFSYSWMEAGQGITGCGAPIAAAMQTLIVPPDATLTLTIANGYALSDLFIQVTPLTAQGQRDPAQVVATPPIVFAASRAEMIAALPPGDYLLSFHTRLANGSADYGFRVTITP